MEDLQHLFHELVGAGHALPLMELNPSMMVADVLQSGGGSSVPFASLMTTVRRSAPLPHLVQKTFGASVL